MDLIKGGDLARRYRDTEEGEEKGERADTAKFDPFEMTVGDMSFKSSNLCRIYCSNVQQHRSR